MNKKIYDATMLIVTIGMLIISYLTYDVTKTRAEAGQTPRGATTVIERDGSADR